MATTFEMDHSVPAGYQNYRTSYYLPSAVVVGRAAGKGCTKSVLVGSGVGSLGRTLHTPVPLLGAASRIEVREPASLPSSVQGDQEAAGIGRVVGRWEESTGSVVARREVGSLDSMAESLGTKTDY